MYNLRTGDGVMKAQVCDELAVMMLQRVDGTWKYITTKSGERRIYEFRASMIHDVTNSFGKVAYRIWLNEGDYLQETQ